MQLTKPKGQYGTAFLLGLLIAFLFFIPYIILDKGYFFYFGDFNVQQVPFYKLAHEAVRNGNLFWSWKTDLGANFIGSYSFYLLGSPFFWLTIPFDASFLPHLMAPLLILKFATASLTSYAFLRRHVKNSHFALIGALLYTFSGFSIYNIFFNHFHEAIAFFPLLLLGLDLFMEEDRRGVFAFAVAINCLANYFFFVGEVVFVALYFVIRMLDKQWKLHWKRFLWLATEAVLGLGVACILLMPSVLAVLLNPRVNSYITGWSGVLYGRSQVFLNIIQTFFFPPDLPARPVFFPDADVKWASLGAWLPLFGMTGVLSFVLAKKGHWLKRILIVSAVMALVPALNSIFYLFNTAYYARWFYMPILLMALATAKSFEDPEVDWIRGIKWSAGITAAFALVIGLMPTKLKDSETVVLGIFNREFAEYPQRFWFYVIIAVVCLWAVTVIIKKRENAAKFGAAALTAVVIVSVLVPAYIVGIGKTYSYSVKDYIIPKAIEGKENIVLPADHFYRVDTLGAMDNLAMFWDLPSLQCFHSIVPTSVQDFYESINVERNVASRPTKEHYALRALTSVQFTYADQEEDIEYLAGDTQAKTAGKGWKDYDDQNGFTVLENENYIPMGFTYDSYIPRSEYDDLGAEFRERAMLKGLVVEDTDVEAVKDTLTALPNPSNQKYSYEAFVGDCNTRKSSACEAFRADKNTFSATIDLPKNNYVFFSVPYDAGWTATVNGFNAEIIRVNVGFMAVKAYEGHNTIEFHYMTPGVQVGAIITGVSLLLLLAYVGSRILYLRRPGRKSAFMAAQEVAADIQEDAAATAEEDEEEFDYEDTFFRPTLSEGQPVMDVDQILREVKGMAHKREDFPVIGRGQEERMQEMERLENEAMDEDDESPPPAGSGSDHP